MKDQSCSTPDGLHAGFAAYVTNWGCVNSACALQAHKHMNTQVNYWKHAEECVEPMHTVHIQTAHGEISALLW